MQQPSVPRQILDIDASRRGLAALMFTCFFLVITSFWILKPIKKGLFIEFYEGTGFALLGWEMSGPQAELLAKVLNLVVAVFAFAGFSWLAHRCRRQQLTSIFALLFMVGFVAFGTVLERPSAAVVWAFYLFGDLFSTLMVAAFFAFLNDSVSPDGAKRLYGLIGLGGVAGGVFGSTAVRALIDSVDRSDWLLVCFGLAVLIVVVAQAAGALVDRNPPPERGDEPGPDQGRGWNHPAVAGAGLVIRSPYLLSIVGIVGLYEIVSTIMDFQFTSTVAHFLSGPAIGRQFATVYAITNVASLFVQLFLTTTIMTRFGVGAALLVLPLVAGSASLGLLAVPTLWMGSLLNTADNAFSYSINQSAKEALYVPTSRAEKYKAKAFIDIFLQRFAKVVAVCLSLVISIVFDDFASIRWLSLLTIAVIVVWGAAALYAGRHFREITRDRA